MKPKHQIIIFIVAFFLSGGLGNIIKDPVKFILIWGGIYFTIKLIIYHNKNIDVLYPKKENKKNKQIKGDIK